MKQPRDQHWTAEMRDAEKAWDKFMVTRLEQLGQLREASRALVRWADQRGYRKNRIVKRVRALLNADGF